mgnify:CR=1 FL=1
MPEILPISKCSEHRQCLACAFPFWDKLTAEQQEMLCRTTRLVRYRKGERVHSPVENCVGILLLRTGQFRAYLLSDDGRDVTSTVSLAARSASSPLLRYGLGEL